MSQSRAISSQRPKCANLAQAGTNAYGTVGNRRVNMLFFVTSGLTLFWAKFLLLRLGGEIELEHSCENSELWKAIEVILEKERWTAKDSLTLVDIQNLNVNV